MWSRLTVDYSSSAHGASRLEMSASELRLKCWRAVELGLVWSSLRLQLVPDGASRLIVVH